MAAGNLEPGLALSYANRADGELRVHLHLPRFEGPAPAGARVRLTKANRSVEAPASIESTPSGWFLTAGLPAGKIRKGTWQLRLKPEEGARFIGPNTRVLNSDPNPISLLMGRIPESTVPPVRHILPTQQKVAHRLGLVADRVLSVLPAPAAKRSRESLRHLARRVLTG